jgi:hypothetical protein
MDYRSLSDDDLLDLIATEEDRLTRAAVDEIIRRKDRLKEILAGLVSTKDNWFYGGADDWTVIHATFILGAISGDEMVDPLLKALRFSCDSDCDWVSPEMPSIFGRIGTAAVEGLKTIAADRSNDWYVRTIALESLSAITITSPEAEDDIFGLTGSIFMDEKQDLDIRRSAAHLLLDFRKREYMEPLMEFGRDERKRWQENSFHIVGFDADDVLKDMNTPEKELFHYTKDWLAFYDGDNIKKRQERWKKEDAERMRRSNKEASDRLSLDAPDAGPFVRPGTKTGRNEPCPCGSGKKYKKCCGLFSENMN